MCSLGVSRVWGQGVTRCGGLRGVRSVDGPEDVRMGPGIIR